VSDVLKDAERPAKKRRRKHDKKASEAASAKQPRQPKTKKKSRKKKLSRASVERLAAREAKLAEKQARRRRRESPLGRFARSEFAQRRVAGMMRFVFAWSRAVGRDRASRTASRVARSFGKRAREHRLAERNLAAAYPEKSPVERAAILAGVWDNLARQSIEYAFLEEMVAAFDPDHPANGPVEIVGLEHIRELRESGKAGVIFGAHIGNWELTAAIGAKLGLPVTALYRPPTNRYIAEEMERRRSNFVDRLVVSGRGAAREGAGALRKGKHIGAIVDQRIADGQVVPFFGRPSLSNPIVGMLARLFDCPVHGAHSIRLPDGRFRLEMTPRLVLPRDARGKVDAEGANVMVHGIIEQGVRAHPEQWLWLHDRWRFGRRRDSEAERD
jgi:KDO2-lipid IV(A) lauroyltransferase